MLLFLLCTCVTALLELRQWLRHPMALAAVRSKAEILLLLIHLRNEFDFWKVHGIMNTSGLLQSK